MHRTEQKTATSNRQNKLYQWLITVLEKESISRLCYSIILTKRCKRAAPAAIKTHPRGFRYHVNGKSSRDRMCKAVPHGSDKKAIDQKRRLKLIVISKVFYFNGTPYQQNQRRTFAEPKVVSRTNRHHHYRTALRLRRVWACFELRSYGVFGAKLPTDIKFYGDTSQRQKPSRGNGRSKRRSLGF